MYHDQSLREKIASVIGEYPEIARAYSAYEMEFEHSHHRISMTDVAAIRTSEYVVCATAWVDARKDEFRPEVVEKRRNIELLTIDRKTGAERWSATPSLPVWHINGKASGLSLLERVADAEYVKLEPLTEHFVRVSLVDCPKQRASQYSYVVDLTNGQCTDVKEWKEK